MSDISKGPGNVKQAQRSIAFVLIGAVALILFWRGIWEVSAKFFSEEVSLVVGLAMLAILAVVERRRLGSIYLK
ncbi:MAG: hypothetical protein ACE5J2_04785 [Nitrososphaerales archaeon]